jgi:hypothetical protein
MPQIDKLASHPIAFIQDLRHKYGDDLVLSFSRYYYIQRSREDIRDSFRVPIVDVTAAWVLRQMAELPGDRELALDSRVWQRGRVRHIPMLDFHGMGRGQLVAVMEALPEYPIADASVYFSGRSFHAYFPLLIRPREWVKFMGSALLCNTPTHPRIVDQRWVGHRLISGYASLRWSRNTKRYRAFPRWVPTSVLDEPASKKLGRLTNR